MAGLTQNSSNGVATQRATTTTTTVPPPKKVSYDDDSQAATKSTTTTPPVPLSTNGSSISSRVDTNGSNGGGGVKNVPTAAHSKGKSIAERSRIPNSFWITYGTICGLECWSGMWTMETLTRWWNSLCTSTRTLGRLAVETATQLGRPSLHSGRELAQSVLILAICASLAYVFFIAPFRAGLWTGRKARRHIFHRYMGLSYLVHYVLAWIEFFTNYQSAGQHSYLCHIIAVMGTLIVCTIAACL
jgi:hypothetical protein